MTLIPGSRVWFYYANKRQVGPLPLPDIRAAVRAGLLGPDDFVYREGFHDWKKLREVTELSETSAGTEQAGLGSATQPKPRASKAAADRRTTDRAAIDELVVAHNDRHIVSGTLTDISISGVFFETTNPCFALNDEIKLTLKEGKGLGKPLNLRGTIVRQTSERSLITGYGIELMNLDVRTRQYIRNYVKQNRAS